MVSKKDLIKKRGSTKKVRCPPFVLDQSSFVYCRAIKARGSIPRSLFELIDQQQESLSPKLTYVRIDLNASMFA